MTTSDVRRGARVVGKQTLMVVLVSIVYALISYGVSCATVGPFDKIGCAAKASSLCVLQLRAADAAVCSAVATLVCEAAGEYHDRSSPLEAPTRLLGGADALPGTDR